MPQFRTHASSIKSIAKQIINGIRTYFLDLWSKIITNETDQQQSVRCSKSGLLDKFSVLNKLKSINKIRRISNQSKFKHLKTDKKLQKEFRNNYNQKKKSHRFSRFCKSIFRKHS